ncbi:MAG: NAD-dependent epimerase/dehydratase family protein, partial [Stackebrandtia sp.]
MDGMRVLLTGAAGFIGTHVHAALRRAGHEVVAVDLMLPAAHGPEACPPDGVARVDIRDCAALDRVLRGIDVVCHQAAVVGAGVDAQDAPAYAGHNDYGTAVLLAAMDRARCPRLVLA